MASAVPVPLRSRTLMSRVMVGVLSLLAVGGVVVALASFAYGRNAARQSFDRLLVGAANDIAGSVSIVDGTPFAETPVSAFSLLSLAAEDRIFYAVQGADGRLLTGYDGIDPRPHAGRGPARPQFFDERLQDEPARFVTVVRRFSEREFSGNVLITVGQTLRARNAMALDLTRSALIVTGLGGIALLVSAFMVIRSAMRPLQAMTQDLLGRDPYDLTPMPTDGPADVAVMAHAMNRFMQRLDRQIGAMKNLISDTAHQLRTPVAAIRAQAELALVDDTPQRPQRLDRLVRRTRSLGNLLDQMLSRAMVIHRTDNAPPQRVDLRDIALYVVESFDHDVLAPQAEVALRIGDVAVIVTADEVSLNEAVKNMLANALRHGVPPVSVGVTAHPDHADIWVQDSGNGPPAEVISAIGERFERTAASKGDSAGLGLSIVSAVARAFGGHMVMTRTGDGFRTTLRLPLIAKGDRT